MTTQVGYFRFEGDYLVAPKGYMLARGNALVARLTDGGDHLFNAWCLKCESVEEAILRRLNEDYADWLGQIES